MDETQRDELRKRRSALATQVRATRDRELHGPRIVASLMPAIGRHIKLSDFRTDIDPPFHIEPRHLKQSSAWAESSISRDRALEIAARLEEILDSLEGFVGVFGNDYLGLCTVRRVSIKGMVAAAEAIEDTIVFYPRDISGAILVDCYKSPPGYPPFSMYIQGRDLAPGVGVCFGA